MITKRFQNYIDKQIKLNGILVHEKENKKTWKVFCTACNDIHYTTEKRTYKNKYKCNNCKLELPFHNKRKMKDYVETELINHVEYVDNKYICTIWEIEVRYFKTDNEVDTFYQPIIRYEYDSDFRVIKKPMVRNIMGGCNMYHSRLGYLRLASNHNLYNKWRKTSPSIDNRWHTKIYLSNVCDNKDYTLKTIKMVQNQDIRLPIQQLMELMRYQRYELEMSLKLKVNFIDYRLDLRRQFNTFRRYFSTKDLNGIKKIKNFNLKMYEDYANMTNVCNLKLEKFPKDLKLSHDNVMVINRELEKQLKLKSQIEKSKMITDTYNKLIKNKFESKEVVILPIKDLNELIKEGEELDHCVGTYADKIIKGTSQIYVMRKKEEIDKPFVTIEVKENKITQCYTKSNKLPLQKYRDIADKWQETLN